MPSPSEAELVLAEARRLAARESWGPLADTLASRVDPAWIAAYPELAVLQAEAKLRLGDPLGARQSLLLGIPVLERKADAVNLRRAVNLLGAAHFELGDLDDAEPAFQRALDLANTDGDDLLVARATNNLALIANIRGRHAAALSLYQLAVPAYQRLGSALGLATTHHNMAITFRDVRQLEEADQYECRAIEFAREAGSLRLLAVARVGRAELSLLRGDPRVAEAGARVAVGEYASVPDPAGEADALRLVGAARAALGEPNEALSALDRAVALAEEHGSALIEAEARRTRAELYQSLGNRLGALEDARAAIGIFDRLGAAPDATALREWAHRVES